MPVTYGDLSPTKLLTLLHGELRRTGGILRTVDGPCRVGAGVLLATVLNLQRVRQVVGFLRDDAIRQLVIERLVILEPLHAGTFVQLARELGIFAGWFCKKVAD